MQKRILAIALGSIMAASSVQASNVTLSGRLSLALDAVDADGGSDEINMNSHQSEIAVSGSEDLGNGLSAIFNAAFEFDPTDSTGFTGRDQWAGLKGGFGSVKFGTASTSYKATGAKLDPLYFTGLQGRANGLQSNLHFGKGDKGQGRMTNAIHYASPSVAGFMVMGNYSFDNSEADGVDDDAYSLGLHYNNAGLFAFVDYVTSDTGGDDDAVKVGASYDLGSFKVYGQYENDGGLITQSENSLLGTANFNGDGRDIWHLAGSFEVGGITLYGGYGQGDESTIGGVDQGDEYDTWTLAAIYGMSKRTNVYVGFNQQDFDNLGEADQFSVGMRHSF